MDNQKFISSEAWQNQYALILGGSSGLGLASAKKLAENGMNICIVHRDRKSNLPNFEKEIKLMESFGVTVKTFNKDALKENVIEEIISALPKNSVKILLHSIAKGSLKSMSGTSEILKIQDLEITIHAMGTSWYQWTAALIENEIFSENARNLAFTSEGNNRVWPGYAAVSAAKSALEALMRNMSIEFASKGINTNCIQAGTTETAAFRAIPGSDDLAKMALNRNPFNRLTTPQDVANAVYLLCRPEADWINGTILKVDGGESNC
ncbi:SDR family oxidoreductase [Aequorivita echinoideorum]|uniref:SDR family oxidoreductase n=1 Tax=Aequorivita echinoideorum TaxID=1549647 RepID=A0ABS5S661_9FLAO|nr:SDR family oxidoreductase [Aequorivita echinoideorum]MBT0608683.1 SDR family oxidoreductase [Aequorivita echinoideorum]